MDTWRLQTDVGGDLAGRVHLCHAGGQQQTLGSEFFTPAGLGGEVPILLASRIGIVTAGRKRRLDGDRAISAERSDHIADHLGAAEQAGERLDIMLDPDHFIIGGFDAGDLVHDRLHPGLVTASGNEGNAEFAQIFADKTPGITGGTVDDDGFFTHGFSFLTD